MRHEASLKHFSDTISEQTKIISCRQCLHCHRMISDKASALSSHLRAYHRSLWQSVWDERRLTNGDNS